MYQVLVPGIAFVRTSFRTEIQGPFGDSCLYPNALHISVHNGYCKYMIPRAYYMYPYKRVSELHIKQPWFLAPTAKRNEGNIYLVHIFSGVRAYHSDGWQILY